MARIFELPQSFDPSGSDTASPTNTIILSDTVVVESLARTGLNTGVTTYNNSNKTISYTLTDGSLTTNIFLPPCVGGDAASMEAYTSYLDK